MALILGEIFMKRLLSTILLPALVLSFGISSGTAHAAQLRPDDYLVTAEISHLDDGGELYVYSLPDEAHCLISTSAKPIFSEHSFPLANSQQNNWTTLTTGHWGKCFAKISLTVVRPTGEKITLPPVAVYEKVEPANSTNGLTAKYTSRIVAPTSGSKDGIWVQAQRLVWNLSINGMKATKTVRALGVYVRLDSFSYVFANH
jgi:hypothetical protein